MNSTQTLERALDILFILAEEETTLSVTEIAEKASIPESTTYRLLQTLEKNGIIERMQKGKISLGLRILELSRVLYQQVDRELYLIAKPTMEKLTEKVDETTVLTVRTGMKVICIQHIESKRLIRLAINNGRTLPLHQGASGKAILAFENKKVIERIMHMVGSEEERVRLAADLEEIRKNGYAKTIGEVDTDVVGISAPIYDEYQRVIASLAIAGPQNRIQGDIIQKNVEAVLKASEEISANLQRIKQPY